MAELAAESVRAAEQPSAEHDAASDADLAEDADEVVDPDGGPVQCSASAARFDSFSTWTGMPEPRLELVGDRNAVPAEVRREHDGAGRLLDETRDGDRDPDRAQALAGRGLERGPRGAPEPVEHGARRRAAVVAVRALRS